MPVNFSELLNPQWEAGTGRKRKIPYTGVMAGSAVNAPEEQRLSKLTELENERISTIATQFDKEQALRREAMGEAESQAKTGNLIQMGGLGLQGAYLATRPEVKELVTGGIEGVRNLVGAGVPTTAAGDLTAGGYVPATKPIFAGGVEGAGTAMTAAGYDAGTAATYGIGTEVGALGGEAAGVAAGAEAGAGIGMGTMAAYAAPVALAYAADQFLNEGRVTETITKAAEDIWDVGEGVFESIIETGGNIVDEIRGSTCTMLTYLYGRKSPQVRYAKVFCARFLDEATLLGYYQTANFLKNLSIKYGLKKYVEKPASIFFKYMKWKLGRLDKISMTDKILSYGMLEIFRMVYKLSMHPYIPECNCLHLIKREGGVICLME